MQIHNYTMCNTHAHANTSSWYSVFEYFVSVLLCTDCDCFCDWAAVFFLRQKEAKCSNFVASGSGFGVSKTLHVMCRSRLCEAG